MTSQIAELVLITFEAVDQENKDEAFDKKVELAATKLVASGLKFSSFGIHRIDVEDESKRVGIKALKECEDMKAV